MAEAARHFIEADYALPNIDVNMHHVVHSWDMGNHHVENVNTTHRIHMGGVFP
jgi:hypothetical protein